jgi:ABC-type glycerol-3-phosphate transport system substrate-binding protein
MSGYLRHFKNLCYKAQLWSITLCLLALSLSACGEESGGTSPQVTLAPSLAPANFPVPVNPKIAALPPFILTVWFADDYYNEAPIVDLIKEFKEAYPNITVAVDHNEWSKLRNKLKEAVAAGNPPDVAHQHAFVFGAQNYAEPLDDLWQQWGKNATAAFLPNSLEDVTWNGIKYGVPLDINTTFLIYNRQMFKDAGLAEPASDYNFTRLREDARKLTLPSQNRYGLALTPGAWDMFGLVSANGGDLLDTHNGQVTAQLDAAPNVQMLQFIANLVNSDKVAPAPRYTKEASPVELFKQRKIAMFFSGPWDLKEIELRGPVGLYGEVGTAVMPHGIDGRTTGSVQGGGSLFVPKGAKNREAAFEFMKWAATPKYQMRLAREMGRYPVLADLYKDPFFTGQPILQPFLEQLKTAKPYQLEAYAQADITWEQSIGSILNGSDPKTTLADAERAIQPTLNSPRK